MSESTAVRLVTADQAAEWFQPGDRPLRLADVIDPSNGDSMSVGFARYAKGASNDWTLSYDEALIITSGQFTVRTSDGAVSARAGEVIYLSNGAEVVYQADEETELVYVTYPHWMDATTAAGRGHQLDEWHPVS